MDCNVSGFPVDSLWPHGLQCVRLPCPSLSPGVAQIHVCLTGDVIQPSHPCQSLLLFPSTFLRIRVFSNESIIPITWSDYWNFSFKIWMLRYSWSFQEYSRLISLGLTALISFQSKGLSRVFSNTTVQKHQFFGTQLSLWSNSHIHIWLQEKP